MFSIMDRIQLEALISYKRSCIAKRLVTKAARTGNKVITVANDQKQIMIFSNIRVFLVDESIRNEDQ